MKWQPRPGILVTAACFDIVESNRPNNVLIVVLTGKIASKGFELEAAASVARDFELTTADSYTDARVTEGNFAPEVGQRVADVPRHLASAWGARRCRSPTRWRCGRARACAMWARRARWGRR